MADADQLVVVDASLVVKWFIETDEDGVDQAATLLAEHARGRLRLVAPALLAHELTSVFVRRLKLERAAEALEAFFDTDVHLVTPDRELIATSVTLIRRCQVSTFDAAYAALARVLGCPLATADLRLANALAGVVETRLV